MGYDSVNHLPFDVKKEDVYEFLKILGYNHKSEFFRFYKDDNYKYFVGVWAHVYKDTKDNEEPGLRVSTRTQIYASDYDIAFMNYTIKQLKKRFGGYFQSDYGKNRYIPMNATLKMGAENGCYFAYDNMQENMSKISYFINNIEDENDGMKYIRKEYYQETPLTFKSNLALTYVASVIENFYRDIYVALLKYSPKKEQLFKDNKFFPDDLVDVSNGIITVEQAYAYGKPFQNIKKICANLFTLNNSINLDRELKKPYRNRKETLYDVINRVLEHRHGLVHRLIYNSQYTKRQALCDAKLIEEAMKRSYQYICGIYNWTPD